MNVKDQETLNALLKKLSAVRVTLSDEEQAVLDWLIQGPHAGFKADEMAANAFATKPEASLASSPDEMAANAFATKPEASLASSPDEMAANAFATKPEAARASSPDEMAANAFATKLQSAKPESIILIYDPEQEAYRYLQ